VPAGRVAGERLKTDGSIKLTRGEIAQRQGTLGRILAEITSIRDR
jgi:hypothetical protein